MRKAWALPLTALALSMALTPEASADRDAPRVDGPTADQLLAKLDNCDQLSNGEYATDDGGTSNIPVCGTGGAVFWQADMDIDCDGQRTEQCNENTDPSFLPETAFTESDGDYLNAAELPFIVVPGATSKFDYTEHGIAGGTIGAVIHGDKVIYAVVGDVGPEEIIGEASYGAAEALGIDPDPATGGAEDGVSYILFPGTEADPLEDEQSAAKLGAEAARKFVQGLGR